MSEALPTIADLFARDPLSLTKEDRTEIIKYYLERRETFISVGQSGTKMPKEPKAKKEKGLMPDIDLGDLDL